jgi:hypothetical protein
MQFFNSIDKADFAETMDDGTIKTQDPKCRLYWCLKEFIDWRYSHVGIFFNPLVNCCPSTFSLTSPRPPPSQKNLENKQTVCGCGGVGVLSFVVGHILQELNISFLTRFRT